MNAFKHYLDLSRTHTYSLLFALPLLLAYETLITTVNRFARDDEGIRNLAEAIMIQIVSSIGLGGPAVLVAILILWALVIIFRERRQENSIASWPLKPGVFLFMLVESTIWALVFRKTVGSATQRIMNPLGLSEPGEGILASGFNSSWTMNSALAEEFDLFEGLALSLGAGLFEELMFRVILIPVIAAALAYVLRSASTQQRTFIAAIISAFLFSSLHYVGVFGDTFSLSSFIFRFLGGLFFSLIYLLRGFGIVAWSHALYDVFFYLFFGG